MTVPEENRRKTDTTDDVVQDPKANPARTREESRAREEAEESGAARAPRAARCARRWKRPGSVPTTTTRSEREPRHRAAHGHVPYAHEAMRTGR